MNRKTERFNSLFWNLGFEAVDAFTKIGMVKIIG
jgi:hypothetical protein